MKLIFLPKRGERLAISLCCSSVVASNYGLVKVILVYNTGFKLESAIKATSLEVEAGRGILFVIKELSQSAELDHQ